LLHGGHAERCRRAAPLTSRKKMQSAWYFAPCFRHIELCAALIEKTFEGR
jgi:hypothetical protein